MQDPWQAEPSKQVRLVRLQLCIPFSNAGFLVSCQSCTQARACCPPTCSQLAVHQQQGNSDPLLRPGAAAAHSVKAGSRLACSAHPPLMTLKRCAAGQLHSRGHSRAHSHAGSVGSASTEWHDVELLSEEGQSQGPSRRTTAMSGDLCTHQALVADGKLQSPLHRLDLRATSASTLGHAAQ